MVRRHLWHRDSVNVKIAAWLVENNPKSTPFNLSFSLDFFDKYRIQHRVIDNTSIGFSYPFKVEKVIKTKLSTLTIEILNFLFHFLLVFLSFFFFLILNSIYFKAIFCFYFCFLNNSWHPWHWQVCLHYMQHLCMCMYACVPACAL